MYKSSEMFAHDHPNIAKKNFIRFMHTFKAYLFLTSVPRQNYMCMCARVVVYHGMRTVRSARSDSVYNMLEWKREHTQNNFSPFHKKGESIIYYPLFVFKLILIIITGLFFNVDLIFVPWKISALPSYLHEISALSTIFLEDI